MVKRFNLDVILKKILKKSQHINTTRVSACFNGMVKQSEECYFFYLCFCFLNSIHITITRYYINIFVFSIILL